MQPCAGAVWFRELRISFGGKERRRLSGWKDSVEEGAFHALGARCVQEPSKSQLA